MNLLTSFKFRLIIIFLFSVLSFNAHAGLAGHVILTKGNVSAISDNGDTRPLKRRSKIMSGDIIKTDIGSSVQIRFIDKALMTIKANSEMNITEYQLAKPNIGGKEKALMTLVKGGFRTISGQIGKGDKSAYKVDTPAASIGIRGTNYEVQQEPNGDFVMAVYSGGIHVTNDSGSIELGLNGDFNFTRVTRNKTPKGLLTAPESLTENSATNESTNTESTGKSKSNSNKEDSEKSEKDSPSSSEGEEQFSEEKETNDVSTESISDNDSKGTTEALDQTLTTALKDNKEEVEDKLIKALQTAGILNNDEDLSDLSQTEKYVIGNIDNSDDIIDLATNDSDKLKEDIANTIIPSPPSTDDSLFIQSLYAGINTANNPFPESYSQNGTSYDLITDQEYNLAASEKLGILAMPMDFSQAANGDLSFNFGEASVESSLALNDSGYAISIAAGTKTMNIQVSFSMLDTSTNLVDEYEIQVPIDIAIITPTDLLNEINNQLSAGYLNISMNGSVINEFDDGIPYPIINLIASLEPADTGFSKFKIESNPVADKFITELDINFSGSDADLLEELMGGNNGDNWHSQVDTDLIIASGAWESDANGDGNPILITNDNEIANDTELIKPHKNMELVNTLGAFLSCGNENRICSIQVLKDDEKIRWGAWLTEPEKGIQIFENYDNSAQQAIREEDKILAFWLAAERADLSSLSGTATFSGTSDCTDFSQCIGFADDGIVQQLTGSLNLSGYNATTGSGLVSGNLNIEVSDDPLLALGVPGAVTSTWSVDFDGVMDTGKPEFITNNITGTVTGSSADTVIGNVGGIFVKPGDIFAGGYNLGTTDGTNKHVSGVFTLDKQ
jgi:hypothetical protein